jgi:hypothetical protein
MILYFDTYITETPLHKKSKPRDDVRDKHEIYKMPSKLEIAKYSLASYSVFPWSDVLIKYELEDWAYKNEFDNFITAHFPNTQIEHERSDSQSDYLNSLSTLKKMGDPWIFYCPNNDHPLLISQTTDIEYINRLIERAEYWRGFFPFVSVIYSHFEEYINAPYPHSANHRFFGKDLVLLYEDNETVVCLSKHGDLNSVQIAHIDLFSHWFTSKDLSSSVIRRAEDLHQIEVKNQILVIPKKRLCAHFDGYEHMQGTANEILQDTSPVLFIPPGFFDKKIKIAYGYTHRKDGYTNLNPAAKKYSFRDPKNGTDLKMSLTEIPLFWKDKIAELDINVHANHIQLNKSARKNLHYQKNPWNIVTRGFNIPNTIFQTKRLLRFLRDEVISKIRVSN